MILREKGDVMRIAVPVSEGKLSMHFGHCSHFVFADVDPSAKSILSREEIPAPDHQPGLLPQWLHEKGADVIIAGGMGRRAQGLFAEKGIQVVIGSLEDDVDQIVTNYLEGKLQTGPNVCDH
jgi:predicted Fe-Mo cluster-binding NifX family protein